MTTIDRVQLNVKPYSDVLDLAVEEMLKVYSYAPRSFDIILGPHYASDEVKILLKQAALLTPGQSTEVRELQSNDRDLDDKTESKYALSEYIFETTSAGFIIVNGDKMQIDLSAQAHRHNDGCTIHTSFDVKYGGGGRFVGTDWSPFCREERINGDLHHYMYDPFDTLYEQTGITDLRENENAAKFVKKLRDNELIPGINLNGLSDEEIENYKFGTANPHAAIVRFFDATYWLRHCRFSREMAEHNLQDSKIRSQSALIPLRI